MPNDTNKAIKVRQGRRSSGNRARRRAASGRPDGAKQDPRPHQTNSFANLKQSLERYLELARTAASAGDSIQSENYLQHADHYFRLVNEAPA